MTEISPGDTQVPHPDETARLSAAYGATLSDEEFAAALRAGRAPVPKKFILVMSLVLVGAIVVGTTVEKLFGSVGQTSRPVKTHFVAPNTVAPSLRALKNGQRGSSLADVLGLRSIEHAPASNFSLTDQHGRPWRLHDYRGHVVVVTFFDVA
ncbi:MAG TPA: hypothetical protein VIC81_01465, partial [Acidimicrobiales bacterium]